MTDKETKKFFYYLNHNNLINEIEKYGYVITVKKLLLTYVMIVIGCLGTAYLFNLAPLGYVILCVVAVILTPIIIVYSYRALYEQRRFSDASHYIEKMLYYFKASEKVLDALEDARAIFHDGVMKDKINEAILFIRSANTDHVEEKALHIIEEEFSNDRIRSMHRFLLNVEKNGGRPDLGIEMMLEDRERWTDNVVLLQKENKKIKTIFISLEILIVGICLLFIYGPKNFPALNYDISIYPVERIASIGLIVSGLVIYTKLSKDMCKNWLDTDKVKSDEEYKKQYEYIVNFDRKKEIKKSALCSIIPAIITAVVYLLVRSKVFLVLGVALTLFILFSFKIGYAIGKRQLEKEIEKAFPTWLLNVALMLQMDNVSMAILNTFETAPGILKPEIRRMLLALDETPNSPIPFNDFMKIFNIPEIHEAMSALYSVMNASGSDIEKEFREILKRNNKLVNKAQQLKNKDMALLNDVYYFIPLGIGSVHLIVDSAVMFICILGNFTTMM